MRSLLTGLIIMYSLASSLACADVYEYVDEAGIVHLSDFALDSHYVLILKSDTPSAIDENSIAGKFSGNSHVALTSLQLLSQIEKSAQRNYLDSELIHAVIQVESAFKEKAQSPKGAQGLMQLMPATAMRLGVKNTYDPIQNIEGGAKYLRELLTLFNNDVSLALAAYNAGESAVIKYGNRIPPYKETQAYVVKVLDIYRDLLKRRRQQ